MAQYKFCYDFFRDTYNEMENCISIAISQRQLSVLHETGWGEGSALLGAEIYSIGQSVDCILHILRL